MSVLHWRDMPLSGGSEWSGYVASGERVHAVAPLPDQFDWLDHCYRTEKEQHVWRIWLETGSDSRRSGSQEFFGNVASMLIGRGLMANLSMRENLLLPFLYRTDSEALAKAAEAVDDVAEYLGVTEHLDERAGERSTYTHALVSLGRCMLQRPEMIIIQDIYIGMMPERAARFRELSLPVFDELQSGILYFSGSQHEGSGLRFDRTVLAEGD